MRTNIFTLSFFILLLIGCNQTKEEKAASSDQNQTEVINADTVTNKKTKMELFTSKTGSILKLTDFNLSNLNTTYSSVETRVRKFETNTDLAYFYQIEKKDDYNDKVASIEYSDLLEVIKGLKILKAQVNNDITANPDYLENKFITVDGFQIGYYVNKGKATWYIKLEKYGSNNTVFINDVNIVETAFNEAKNKIEELKK